jgi:hypothetical protein
MSRDESVVSKSFNLEETLGVLEELAHDAARTREQGAAIESAAKALHFIRRLGKLDDFRDYLRDFDRDTGSATRVVQSFSSMSEATEWLRAQQDPPYGATVEVAGLPHLIARQRADTWFLVPAPSLPPPAPGDEP